MLLQTGYSGVSKADGQPGSPKGLCFFVSV